MFIRGIILLFLFFLSVDSYCKSGIVEEILIEGNDKTKSQIIYRELSFKIGDSIPLSKVPFHIQQSKNNLLNTFLFNFVEITFKDTLNSYSVKIVVEERWYLWPEIVFKFQERNFTEWLRNRNFSRIDYGTYLTLKNVRGLNETLKLLFQVGFNKSLGAFYEIPNLTKAQKNGLNFGFSYNTQNEVFLNLEDNLMVYEKLPNSPFIINWNGYTEYIRRDGIYTKHALRIDWNSIVLANQINDFNPNYLSNNNSTQFLSLSYFFKLDRRDSRNYPLQGYYADFRIAQHGLSVFKEPVDVTRMSANIRKFDKLSKKWYLSYGGYSDYYLQNDVDFFFQQGLGFSRFVRGYEPYVIFGQQSHLIKTNLKYSLFGPIIKTIPKLKVKKFNKFFFAMYTNLYVDAGYVSPFKSATPQTLNNQLLLGYGIGVDFVTYYDLVWRIEASRNLDKLTGIYIGFTAPL